VSGRGWSLVACLGLGTAALACAEQEDVTGPAEPGTMTLERMQTELARHGEWTTLEGRRVFRPAADRDFRPYGARGQWLFGDEGWVYESEEPWAKITYHYGRWFRDGADRWVWAPDAKWAPAWVEWRAGHGYVGWTVLAPAGVRQDRVEWVFVRTQDFVAPAVGSVALHPQEAAIAYRETAETPHVRGRFGEPWSVGPAPQEISAATGAAVPRARFAASRGSGPQERGRGGKEHDRSHRH
jgi:Family of unknown function (DUF6600)